MTEFRLKEFYIPICDLKLQNHKLPPVERDLDVLLTDDARESDLSSSNTYQIKLRKKKRVDYSQQKFHVYEEDEDFDPVEDPHTKSAVKKPVKSKESKPVLSNYEKMIADRRAEALAFLQTIKIDEVKSELLETVGKIRVKRAAPKPKLIVPEKFSITLRDKIGRGERPKSGMLCEDTIEKKAYKKAKEELSNEDALKKLEIYPKKVKKYTWKGESLVYRKGGVHTYFQNVNVEFPGVRRFIYQLPAVRKLDLGRRDVAVVAPERISVLRWFSSEKKILAAGTTKGNYSLWRVDSGIHPLLFQSHKDKITHMAFSPFYSQTILTSSSDGTLCSSHMVWRNKKQVFADSESVAITYFDFISRSQLLVAKDNGKVSVVDIRHPGPYMMNNYSCHSCSITSLNIHPQKKVLFLTSAEDGSICLWDSRYMKEDRPVLNIASYNKKSHAFLSPITGNSILVTSATNQIDLYDSTCLNNIRIKKSLTLRNIYEDPISHLATWLPDSEDMFSVIKSRSPVVWLFNTDMICCRTIECSDSEAFSTHAFHSFIPALAVTDLNGKVVVCSKHAT